MPRVLYTAFDIVPSPKGASTHILHNLRGLVNGKFDVHLVTPNDGLLPTEDALEGARVTRVTQDLSQNFLSRATHFGQAVFQHLMLHHDYNVAHYRNIWDGLAITDARDFSYPQSQGADLYRRSLYTFWRRTAAPGNMFDAASRQVARPAA